LEKTLGNFQKKSFDHAIGPFFSCKMAKLHHNKKMLASTPFTQMNFNSQMVEAQIVS
jgi:hypothetical protein